ncbi:HPr kinase [Oleiphilus messinensis]|uniref:HPr kinase n=2 Tax=Oleiphilus messinensis TaxID=141451 RepID=A0A1Y0IB13_9GAMM|nr:HPr kinase [Oleiphilus messinensis]
MDLPELKPVPPSDTPDISIVAGCVPEVLTSGVPITRRLQIGETGFQFTKENIARYLCLNDRVVIIDNGLGGTPAEIRLYLYSSVFAIIQHKKCRLPLHASAVGYKRRAYAFAGDSGAGKSTLAAALFQRDLELISDDLGVLEQDGSTGYYEFHPGQPYLKLWKDTASFFNYDTAELVKDPRGISKYHCQLKNEFVATPRPLHAIFFLTRTAGKPYVSPVSPKEGVTLLVKNIYRIRFALHVGTFPYQFDHCAKIAQSIPLFRYHRPWCLDAIERSLEPVLSRIEALA